MDLHALTSKRKGNPSPTNRSHIPRNATFARKKFVERLLFIENKEFLIVPNGGTGDCCFKAIAQAIEGSEVAHGKVREEVVNFIINYRWDKFKESIEVQHVQGNRFLQTNWMDDPLTTYQNYMNTLGTLGSASELNAAGELFQYNFVTIQEYSDGDKKTYRVENCCPYDDPSSRFHYFFFTGDFDNGHWEYLEPTTASEYCLNSDAIPDGIYPGLLKIIIDGIESTVEEWLKIHTHYNNDEFQLKHSITRYPSRKSAYPFECEGFKYSSNHSVILKGLPYRISKLSGTDLFTVLLGTVFPDVDQSDASVLDRLEDQIVSYRAKNIYLLNYKLITQPHSHGFDISSLKYLSMTCKGNVQDLLASAILFGFSFEIFIKPDENEDPTIRSCRFVHVDRWGGETDRILYFFMRLSSIGAGPDEELMAKWWNLNPEFENTKSNNNNNAQGDLDANHNGDFITAKSSSKDNSKIGGEVSLSGSGDDRESLINKNQQQLHNVSSNYDSTENEEEEEEEEENESTKTHVGETTQSESDSYDEDDNEQENTITTREMNIHISRRSSQSKSRSAKHSQRNSDFNVDKSREASKMYRNKESDNREMTEEYQEEVTRPTPKIQTQVFIYDEATNRKREYRFQGVKTRGQVLAKLLKLGYIKKIPADSSDVIINSQIQSATKSKVEQTKTELKNSSSFAKIVESKLSKKFLVMKNSSSSQHQNLQKCDSAIMKAAEKFKQQENIANKNESKTKWSKSLSGILRHLSPRSSKAKVSSTKIAIKSPQVSSTATILDLDNKNESRNDIILNLEEHSKEEIWELPIPQRVKSVSALALADQDSVERNSKFLALHHKVSPYAQRKAEVAERIEKEAKNLNLLERFMAWIASWFKTCKKTKASEINNNSL